MRLALGSGRVRDTETDRMMVEPRVSEIGIPPDAIGSCLIRFTDVKLVLSCASNRKIPFYLRWTWVWADLLLVNLVNPFDRSSFPLTMLRIIGLHLNFATNEQHFDDMRNASTPSCASTAVLAL